MYAPPPKTGIVHLLIECLHTYTTFLYPERALISKGSTHMVHEKIHKVCRSLLLTLGEALVIGYITPQGTRNTIKDELSCFFEYLKTTNRYKGIYQSALTYEL